MPRSNGRKTWILKILRQYCSSDNSEHKLMTCFVNVSSWAFLTKEDKMQLLVLFCKIQNCWYCIDMVIISNIILLIILGLNCFDDGPDVSLIEDGLRHLRHVDGGTSQKKLLHQQLYPVKIILVRGASFKLNLQKPIDFIKIDFILQNDLLVTLLLRFRSLRHCCYCQGSLMEWSLQLWRIWTSAIKIAKIIPAGLN